MPSESEVQELEDEAAETSQQLDEVNSLIIEFSTTNIIVQPLNMAEVTFAVTGSAYSSESMPQMSPAQPTSEQSSMPMDSGY